MDDGGWRMVFDIMVTTSRDEPLGHSQYSNNGKEANNKLTFGEFFMR